MAMVEMNIGTVMNYVYTLGYSKHIRGSLVFQFRNYIILSGC